VCGRSLQCGSDGSAPAGCHGSETQRLDGSSARGSIFSLAADIRAALGYLAVGLAFAAAEVALIRNRERFIQYWTDEMVAGDDARWRWPQTPEQRIRRGATTFFWSLAAFGLPLGFLAFVASAVAEFRM
jgi:hypothetical protein